MRAVVALVVVAAHGCLAANYATECRANDCDRVADIGHVGPGKVVMYQTSMGNNDRLARYELNITQNGSTQGELVQISENITYQTIVGFGGAFTDAAAENFAKLNLELQAEVIEQYFGVNGLGYSLGRIPIGPCDFSTTIQTYDDVPEDLNLTHFSIAQDHVHRIPFIQRALESSFRNITLFASPWSPPAWMKTNNNVTNGKLRGGAGSVYAKAWARYISKFLDAYAQESISVWAVTVQNEPQAGRLSSWQATEFSAAEEGDFVSLDLGPQLAQSHPEVLIIAHDDQRVILPSRANTILANNATAKFVSGLGFHWYAEVGDLFHDFFLLSETHNAHPSVFLLPTEACTGSYPWDSGPSLGSWERGERYGYDILNDLRNWAVGWTDWNLILDLKGGPNWAGNFVDAPILADTASGDIVYKNPMFYYIGHFSRFIPKGSVRVSSKVAASAIEVESVAFVTPQQELVVVILNTHGWFSKTFTISIPGRGNVVGHIPPKSIQTFIVPASGKS